MSELFSNQYKSKKQELQVEIEGASLFGILIINNKIFNTYDF